MRTSSQVLELPPPSYPMPLNIIHSGFDIYSLDGGVTRVVLDDYGDVLADFEVKTHMVLEEVWAWRTHTLDNMFGS